MTDWIDWQGGECPVAADAAVEVRMVGDELAIGRADDFCWDTSRHDLARITTYRVLPTFADLAEKDAEIERLRKENDLLTHQVITCGVAARHPDANLSRAGAYAGKWNSQQAEDVRTLRDERDRLRAELAQARDDAEWVKAEVAKSERRAIMFGDLLDRQIIAMRAAVVAAAIEGPEVGMCWIENTLCGPGHLPDADAARELGGAQALFDKEIVEHEAFRAAHPMPERSLAAAIKGES